MFNYNFQQKNRRRPESTDIKNTKCFHEFYPRDYEDRVLPMWLNSSLNDESGNHSCPSYTHRLIPDDQI